MIFSYSVNYSNELTYWFYLINYKHGQKTMIRNVYSIRDQKTQAFDAPLQFENDSVAKRFFTRAIENVPLMAENPSDFDLYQIGTFCSETATLAPLDAVQLKFNGLNCLLPSSEGNNANEKTKVGDDSPVQPST